MIVLISGSFLEHAGLKAAHAILLSYRRFKNPTGRRAARAEIELGQGRVDSRACSKKF
jgi:hypothetical protein